MHILSSVVLQLVLCLTAFCRIAHGSESVKGKWNDISNITESNYWKLNVPLWKNQYDNNELARSSIAATYCRSMTSKRAKARVLFIDQYFFAWVYSPRTASWTKLPEKRNQRIQMSLSLPKSSTIVRSPNRAVTLCDSRVVLFSGFSVERNGHIVLSNDLWIFDGIVEEWSSVRTLARAPEVRDGKVAFAFRRNESTCRCKDSLFVYGGSDDLDDLWELRCVDDKNETDMKYDWIKNDLNAISWPKNASHMLFASKTVLYWVTNDLSMLSVFDTITEKYLSSRIEIIDCPHVPDIYDTYLLKAYKELLDSALHLKEHHLLIFFIALRGEYSGYKESDFLGVLDLQKSVIHCINVSVCHREESRYQQDILFLTDDKVLLLGTDIYNGSVAIWSFQTSEMLRSLKTNSLLNIECDAPNYDGDTHGRYPVMMIDHRFMRITDSVWYLMKIWYPSDLQMWLFEVDILRWSIYDPDEKPETMLNALEAATATTANECVAYFGSGYGYVSSAQDDLWMYATRMRTWTRVVSRGKAPKKLTSYATMSSLDNGSLVLFGGVDNRKSSLWMVTVDYERMTATWERLCCEDDREQPTNQLQKWSSAVWNNTLYIYFCQRTEGNCESIIYYKNLGNVAEWTMKESRVSGIGTFCKSDQTVFGRFAYTTDDIGNLVMADFNRVEYNMAGERKFPANSKAVLGAQSNGMFSFTSGPYGEVLGIAFRLTFGLDWQPYLFDDSRIRTFRLIGCKPGSFSPKYSVHSCQSCPKGRYSDRYNSTNCTSCPSGLITTATGSNSIINCTCTSGTCVYGDCVVQSDLSTLCLCYTGYTGKKCESPTMYLVFMGVIVGILLVIAFYYIAQRARKHQNAVKYTRVELEMAEQMVEELSNIWSITTDEIEFGQKIGEGSFGDVWTADYRDQTVAVKVLKIEADNCTNEQLQEFKDESELLRSIFHANIVRLIGTGKTTENKPFIALEYMEQGSVRNALDNAYADRPIEIYLQVKYALDAAKGMRHLHRLRRMHRDLKCDNLLIDYRGVVKVADLGCTIIVPKIPGDEEDEDKSGKIKGSRAVGTSFFRAPEIFRGEAYDIAVDVYSYGISLWEIQTAKNPYFEKYESGMTTREILDEIVNKDVRPEFLAQCNEDLKQLTISCWNGNPYERPTFEEIAQTLENIR